jgi:hypothetical protein
MTKNPIPYQYKNAVMSCIEEVLMKRGDTNYNLILANLNSFYDRNIRDCYEFPEYLRTAIKKVYGDYDDYRSIIYEIKLKLDYLVDEEYISNFFKTMESFTIAEPLLKCPKCDNVWTPEPLDTWGFFLGDDKCPKCHTKGEFVRFAKLS